MENLNPLVVSYDRVYSSVQEDLVQAEFSRLKDQCYLEHAGATLYSEKQIQNVLSDLTSNTFGNPHARNVSSKLTEDAVDQIRYMILQHFNTGPEDYGVVFTSGSTAALKLVAEAFRYSENDSGEEHGTFAYLQDNHTSVLGMREYAEEIFPLSHDAAFRVFSDADDGDEEEEIREKTRSLFVYPAQCNYSGAKYPLSWIGKVQRGALNSLDGMRKSRNWFCLLDAAAFASTGFLDLSVYKPDFVCLSFYKIFGYPTGLGALLVRNSSVPALDKRYFGGGTVLMALSSERVHVPRPVLHERCEDGTLPFLQIVALRHGFDTLKRLKVNMNDISRHTFSLAKYVYQSLLTLHHENGKPAAVLYHDTNFEDVQYQGGIVNFNLLRPSGEYIGYAEVLHIANLYKIHLRTGCFCNPGACQRHLKLTTQDVRYQFDSGHVCGDENDLINGYPTGSVRISFGYMSAKKDADMFLKMIEECFVSKPVMRKLPETWTSIKSEACRKFRPEPSYNGKKLDFRENSQCTSKFLNGNGTTAVTNGVSNSDSNCDGSLQQIFIYPIKSCAAFTVDTSWELVNTGFRYDRQWMIINSAGVCVTQKNDTRLCVIRPEIDLKNGLMQLHYEGLPSISIPLNAPKNGFNAISGSKCQSKVCGDRIQGWDCGDEVANWLTDSLGILGLRLLRQCNNSNEITRTSKLEKNSQLSLTNQAQFLLINSASVQWLLDRIPVNEFDGDLQDLIGRFRPNFVANFQRPFVENSFSKLRIGRFLFKYGGNCTRCQMICINQSTGEKSVEPLKTLSKEFKGKIAFGIYLSNISEDRNYCKLHIDDPIVDLSVVKPSSDIIS